MLASELWSYLAARFQATDHSYGLCSELRRISDNAVGPLVRQTVDLAWDKVAKHTSRLKVNYAWPTAIGEPDLKRIRVCQIMAMIARIKERKFRVNAIRTQADVWAELAYRFATPKHSLVICNELQCLRNDLRNESKALEPIDAIARQIEAHMERRHKAFLFKFSVDKPDHKRTRLCTFMAMIARIKEKNSAASQATLLRQL